MTLSEALERRIMSLTLFKIYIFMCGFCSRFQIIACKSNKTLQTPNEVLPGSDVSLRCDVSLLSESSTLKWETEGQQTSNTTLIYNNSAYIILHTVNEGSRGEYYCRLMEDGKAETVQIHTLSVKTNSHNGNIKTNTIYRQSSKNSEVSLICKSKRRYESWKWTWEPRSPSQIDLIAVEKGGEVEVKGPIKSGRRSSSTHDSQYFIFHISPVNFNYSGTYRCITETGTYTTTILHTIRVSVEPSDGVLRNQSVLLTCEVSEVTDSVTLVWLRMEGNRGILGKQQIMTKNNNKLQLTVDVSGNETDSLHWQCAVFTKNTLRALAPITSNTNNNLNSSTTNQVNSSHAHHAQAYAFSVLALFAGILFGALLYTFYRKRIVHNDPQESEPVYINIREMRNDRETTRINKRDETPVTDSVTYATIYFNKPRVQTHLRPGYQ